MANNYPATANNRACVKETDSVDTWELVGIIPLSGGPLHQHIMPTGDTVEHAEDSGCWCRPFGDGVTPNLWIHNSADGRELSQTCNQQAVSN